jgi:hypothetical protein
VEYPIGGAISNPAATGGAGGKLQGCTSLVSVCLSHSVGGQQGLSFIIPKLAGLAANLTGQGLPILTGDAAGVGGNIPEAGGDGAADLEASHGADVDWTFKVYRMGGSP